MSKFILTSSYHKDIQKIKWKYMGFVEWNQNIYLGWHANQQEQEHVKRAKDKNFSIKQNWEKGHLTL